MRTHYWLVLAVMFLCLLPGTAVRAEDTDPLAVLDAFLFQYLPPPPLGDFAAEEAMRQAARSGWEQGAAVGHSDNAERLDRAGDHLGANLERSQAEDASRRAASADAQSQRTIEGAMQSRKFWAKLDDARAAYAGRDLPRTLALYREAMTLGTLETIEQVFYARLVLRTTQPGEPGRGQAMAMLVSALQQEDQTVLGRQAWTVFDLVEQMRFAEFGGTSPDGAYGNLQAYQMLRTVARNNFRALPQAERLARMVDIASRAVAQGDAGLPRQLLQSLETARDEVRPFGFTEEMLVLALYREGAGDLPGALEAYRGYVDFYERGTIFRAGCPHIDFVNQQISRLVATIGNQPHTRQAWGVTAEELAAVARDEELRQIRHENNLEW